MKRSDCRCRYLGRVGCYRECDPCKRRRLERGLAKWRSKTGTLAAANVALFEKTLRELEPTAGEER